MNVHISFTDVEVATILFLVKKFIIANNVFDNNLITETPACYTVEVVKWQEKRIYCIRTEQIILRPEIELDIPSAVNLILNKC